MDKNTKIRRGDLKLITAVLLCGVLLVCALRFARRTGSVAEVRVDGSVVKSIPLSADAEYVIEGVNGTNTLSVKGGCAGVISADCPDGLCVGMGSIQYTGQSIICLPNKVVIEIKGTAEAANDPEDDLSDIDIIVGGRRQ